MRKTIGISISAEQLAKIDKARGLIPRSAYMVHAALAVANKSGKAKQVAKINADIDAAKAKAHPETYECATCGMQVDDETPHEHADTWQGS